MRGIVGGYVKMNIKSVVILVSIFLFMALFCVPLTFAQYWNTVNVSVCASEVSDNISGGGGLELVIAVPPEGSEISNSISAYNILMDENFEYNCSEGDTVYLFYASWSSEVSGVEIASEENHFIVTYEGEADVIQINGVGLRFIPELSSIMLIATLALSTLFVVIVTRRKRQH